LLTTRAQRDYQTLPSRRHQYSQPLKLHCAVDRRRFAAARAVDDDDDCDAAAAAAATGNSYGGRSSSVADGRGCGGRRLLTAVSDVDLASSRFDRRELSAWKHRPSVTDLSTTAASERFDPRADDFADLLRDGRTLQALPDTHL